MKKLNNKGFTIVELVIVIAVIAILASVLIPTFSGVVSKANESAALQTARSTLTNALNMSSTAQLTGKTANGGYRTMFVVDGYAYGYTGNELEAIDYPTSDSTTFLHTIPENSSDRNAFNAILISSDNLVKSTAEGAAENDYVIKNVDMIINRWTSDNKVGCTDLTVTSVKLVNGHYYVNYTPASGTVGQADYSAASYDAEIYVNSDFSNKVVVFTTFG